MMEILFVKKEERRSENSICIYPLAFIFHLFVTLRQSYEKHGAPDTIYVSGKGWNGFIFHFED